MDRWGLGLAGAVLVGGAAWGFPLTSPDARVVRVVDGDTLIAGVDGGDTTIRLLNIYTPETKDPSTPVECLGPEATDFVAQMLPTRTKVRLRYDKTCTEEHWPRSISARRW